MTVLVTGGAGYIGSHMTHLLCERGHDVWVVDDLSSGHRDAVHSNAEFSQLAIEGIEAAMLAKRRIEAVFHFASKIEVGESVRDPALHYKKNVGATLLLLEAVRGAGVSHFIFSSSAAVYGSPKRVPIVESDPLDPVNPYGFTKRVIERVLSDYDAAYGLKSASLRYFNAAGANVEAGLGERHDPESHLIPNAIDAALGRKTALSLFGNDYETKDGTCLRDFVHVLDLAEGHLLAWNELRKSHSSLVANLGSGQGATVLEVIQQTEKTTGKTIPVEHKERRAGDPPALVADIAFARTRLGFAPTRSTLERIIGDACSVRR